MKIENQACMQDALIQLWFLSLTEESLIDLFPGYAGQHKMMINL